MTQQRAGDGRRVGAGQSLIAYLERIPGPQIPATTPWRLSISDLLPTITGGPRAAVASARGLRGFVGRRFLDRFGELYLGPDGLGVNRRRIAWRRIEEIRVRGILDAVNDEVVGRLSDQIGKLVPRFVPGRKRLTASVMRSVLGVTMYVVQTAGRGAGIPPLVPYEIVHRGRFGQRHVTPVGAFALLVIALVPRTNPSIAATASRFQIVAAIDPTVLRPQELGPRAQILLQRCEQLAREVFQGRLARRARAATTRLTERRHR